MKDTRKNFKISAEMKKHLQMLSDRLKKPEIDIVKEFLEAMVLTSANYEDNENFGYWMNVGKDEISIVFHGNPTQINGQLTQPVSSDFGDAVAEKTLKNAVETELVKPKKDSEKQ
jgi:predicted DNA-binding protein